MEKMFCQNKNFGFLKMTFEVNFLRQPPFLIFLKMFYMTPVLKAIFHVTSFDDFLIFKLICFLNFLNCAKVFVDSSLSILSKKQISLEHIEYRPVASGPPVFGRTVNPISTRGQIMLTTVLSALPDFQTLRRPWNILLLSCLF